MALDETHERGLRTTEHLVGEHLEMPMGGSPFTSRAPEVTPRAAYLSGG